MSSGGNSHNLLAGLLVGGFLAAYAALSHYISVLPEGKLWAIVVAVVPAIAMLLDMARRSFGKLGLGVIVLAASAAVVLAWPFLRSNVSWVYFLQHLVLNICLGLLFARTLIGGRQPLCTYLATFVHQQMSPAVTRYTRQVTLAWAAFFFVIAAISLLLFASASVETWSIFANLLNTPLVGLMFVAEHLVRKSVLPPEDQLGPTAAFRAYQAARKARQMPAPPPSPQS